MLNLENIAVLAIFKEVVQGIGHATFRNFLPKVLFYHKKSFSDKKLEKRRISCRNPALLWQIYRSWIQCTML